ncbi:MAG: grasp-with-spasm system SPASM domain peptide maturase [Bacteroidia bacterium]|jgi:SPASM domain peptide maturase of grasp-with-spasm system
MKIDLNKYILLFESCQLTKGFGRTLLTDLQRNKIEFLDNEIYDIFSTNSRTKTIAEIIDAYNDEKKEIILDYFLFLIDNEYAFLCDKTEIDYFPKLNKNWDHPSIISNCIIDFDKVPANLEIYKIIIADLDDLGCENIQIRDFIGLPFDFLNSFLKLFEHSIVFRIELVLKFTKGLEKYNQLLSIFPRVNELVLHTCDIDIESLKGISERIYLTKELITDQNCCGIISPKYFNLNQDHFLESTNYNSCLNRKISIDSDGIIKNCPSMANGFGKITDVRIKDIVKQEQFKAIWNIKKDLIDDCKVCEFRHVCTDCRAYLETDHSLKKPAKCNYNPYEMVWE